MSAPQPASDSKHPTQAHVNKIAKFHYIPVYELVMALFLALIAIISSIALVGNFLFGEIQWNQNFIIVLIACFTTAVLAAYSFQFIFQSWLRVKVSDDIELHWWLRRVTTHIPLDNAREVQLEMYISPIFGMRSEATLTVTTDQQTTHIPVLRHLLPLKSFRQQASLLAKSLQVPLRIPECQHIPLGFRNAFDQLRPHQNNTSQILKILHAPITWQATDDGDYPYQVQFDGQTCEIRVNDWPEYETVYSLLIAKKPVRDLHSLPDNWKLPEHILSEGK
ncbi:MAG: hypothetical protein L3J39_09035 [Verrucomicrobiales bacterium]|nr:hypothetical protein [Verrucomicrobiales bacterium]